MPITNTPKLTEENKKWIKAHSDKFTAREISDWMQVAETVIRSYCRDNSLSIKKPDGNYTPPESIYFNVDAYFKSNFWI